MQLHSTFLMLLLSTFVIGTQAQNTSPYWSLAGNSNAASTSKLGTTTAVPLNLTTNNQTRLQIFENGRVGVGSRITNANAPRVLNLADDNAVMRILRTHSSFAPAVELISRTSADGANVAYWDFYAEPSDKSFRIRDRIGGGAGLDRLTVSGSGNVGIGTTTPAAKLDVRRTDGQAWLTKFINGSTTGDRTALIDIQNGNGVLWRYGVGGTGNGLGITNGQFYIERAGSGSYFTIDADGKIYLSGSIYMAGNRFISDRGNGNNYFGTHAGNDATTGQANTAVGSNALVYNNGSGNTATGASAMLNNTTGYWNVATGRSAGERNTTGSGNTALGYSALRFNTTGQVNVAVGGLALYQVNGSSNTAVGYDAGLFPTSLSQCTMLGASSTVANGLTNATAIGYRANATASNQIMLGNTSVTSVVAAGSYYLYSDGRFKKDLKDDVPGLQFINALKPVTYHYNIHDLNKHIEKGRSEEIEKMGFKSNEAETKQKEAESINAKEAKRFTGFVAQDVEHAARKLGYDFSGIYKPANANDVYGLSYAEFVVPLVKAVQELSKENEQLKKNDTELRNELAELKQLVSKMIDGRTINTSLSDGALLQNAPNPVRGTTAIKYSLPEGSSRGQLLLTDALGRTIKVIQLTTSGVVNVDVSTLSSGLYNYSLVVDGKTLQTKKMTVKR